MEINFRCNGLGSIYDYFNNCLHEIYVLGAFRDIYLKCFLQTRSICLIGKNVIIIIFVSYILMST